MPRRASGNWKGGIAVGARRWPGGWGGWWRPGASPLFPSNAASRLWQLKCRHCRRGAALAGWLGRVVGARRKPAFPFQCRVAPLAPVGGLALRPLRPHPFSRVGFLATPLLALALLTARLLAALALLLSLPLEPPTDDLEPRPELRRPRLRHNAPQRQ